MKKLNFITICLSIFLSTVECQESYLSNHAITYTLSGGRFGDNLLAYMHAKWVSYRYQIPLLYKPFPLSDQLVLDDLEMNQSSITHIPFSAVTSLSQNETLDTFMQKSSFFDRTLYIIPYFPESEWERIETYDTDKFPYFRVDWENEEFKSLLKSLIFPKYSKFKLKLPKNKVSVAVHVRSGRGYDHDATHSNFPLKFPDHPFYIEQIRNIYFIFNENPLYVYLFTDDPNPEKFKKKYEKALEGLDIEFDYRKKGNRWNANILEDFFALTQFDCAIHGESNFSVCAGHLANYKVEITPKSFYREDGKNCIDSVLIKIKENIQ